MIEIERETALFIFFALYAIPLFLLLKKHRANESITILGCVITSFVTQAVLYPLFTLDYFLPESQDVFASVETIMEDVNYEWLARYVATSYGWVVGFAYFWLVWFALWFIENREKNYVACVAFMNTIIWVALLCKLGLQHKYLLQYPLELLQHKITFVRLRLWLIAPTALFCVVSMTQRFLQTSISARR